MRRVIHLFGTALRETGQAVDRLGLTLSNNEIFRETFSRHRSVMNLFDKVLYIYMNNGYMTKMMMIILDVNYGWFYHYTYCR
jgi:hypothetical protein